MLKAAVTFHDDEPGLIIGLSHENLRRLKAGQPIVFNLSDLGLPARRVLILAGETEEVVGGQLGLLAGGNHDATH